MSKIPFARNCYAKPLFQSLLPKLHKVLRKTSASLKMIAAAAERTNRA